MSELQDRLNAVGWMQKEPRADYDLAVFRLLHLLVDEIERLQHDLDATNRTLASRTEHLV